MGNGTEISWKIMLSPIVMSVNHSVNFEDPTAGAQTRSVKSFWRHVKRTLPDYNRRKHSRISRKIMFYSGLQCFYTMVENGQKCFWPLLTHNLLVTFNIQVSGQKCLLTSFDWHLVKTPSFDKIPSIHVSSSDLSNQLVKGLSRWLSPVLASLLVYKQLET